MTTTDVGMMKGAHPTAPGGMSQKALIAELVEVHGFDRANAKALSWPQMIDVVAANRKAREDEQRCEKHETINCAECNGLAAEHDASLAEPEDDFSDLDDLLAEFEEASTTDPIRAAVEAGATYDEAEDPDQYVQESDTREDAALFAAPTTSDEDFDPDEMMAELATIRDEEAEHAIQYGLLIKDPHTNDYIFDNHAGAGPSASERWMHCTASLGASREFLETLTPNQQEQFANSNMAARQGTTAHAAAEVEARVILGEMTQEEADLTMLELSIQPESDGEAYDEEMGDYITEYVDLVRGYAQDRGNENVLIEQRVVAAVPLTGMHEGEVYEVSGSGDCIVLPTPDETTLVVADLKYGNGIWVGVDENPQARIYALGALGLLVDDEGVLTVDTETVTYHIVQPRMDGIKTWSEPLADLLLWRDEVLAPRLTAALYGASEGATFAPSEQACQFCPARGGCAALAEDRLTRAADLFDVVVEAEFNDGPGSFPETASLTDTRLGELLVQISGLISIHDDLKAEAQRRLYRGDSVPGFQLVNYSPPRKWTDDAGEVLEGVADLWSKKLMTPTQALKLAAVKGDELDRALIESLVETPDKRPVVAREGDRRKPWTGRPPEAMFDDESGAE